MNRCNLYPCFTDEETGTVIQSNCLEVTIKFLSRTLFESLTLLPVVITFLSIHPLISSSLCPFSCTFFPSLGLFIHPPNHTAFLCTILHSCIYQLLLSVQLMNHSLKLLFISPSLFPFSFSQPCIHPPTIQPIIRQPSIHFHLSIFSFHLFLLPLHSPPN